VNGAASAVPAARADFLVELGTEELPPKALGLLEAAFRDSIVAQLDQYGLKYGRFESFSTPRRLAVRVTRLAAQQPEQTINRRGPPLKAAFDAAGLPTRAGSAFADSCGVALAVLGRETDPKGNEYLSFSGTKAGEKTTALLPGIVQRALDALPTPKRMRWGASEVQFVRPVHWLLMLYGRELVPTALLDVTASNTTRGHRFMAPATLRVGSPATYEKSLLTRGKVIASFAARRERIREQVVTTAAALSGTALISEAVLDEVTALVEWPVAVAGQFEARFLQLPREVLISTLQDHQRYFPVLSATGGLLPWFITISNVESSDPAVVRAGNERVVRPRLADAAFFYEQDRKQPLAARLLGLDAVTFQVKLGSVGAKVQRVSALAQRLCTVTGADAAQVQQAAELCKCDLLSAIVGEFPELQGVMGRYYALADGVAPEVAEAVREHYLPRGAGDDLPTTRTGLTVALADRLDTLAGIFSIGQKPTGTKDPFALRRAAIGVLRIVMEQRLPLDLPAVIGWARAAQPFIYPADGAAPVSSSTQELYDYFMERLRAQYLEDASAGLTTEMFNAVLEVRPAQPLDFDARLRALVLFLKRPEAASLTAANKRIANILKKSALVPSTAINTALLQLPAEMALHAAVDGLLPGVEAALARGNYATALDALSTLKAPVDAFFDAVLVNDPDEALRDNRLAVLARVRTLFTRIADLSLLPG
jgi:glycyl-tRNA synthetase beta chain